VSAPISPPFICGLRRTSTRSRSARSRRTPTSHSPTIEFSDVEEAKRFIDQRPGRYVLKSNGPDAASFVGRHKAGADVRAVLAAGGKTTASSFILMDFVEGVEMGVGAYFNGEDFLEPVGSTSASSPAISANSPAKWAQSSPTRAQSVSSIIRSPKWRRFSEKTAHWESHNCYFCTNKAAEGALRPTL
jgi:hypothetical protein